MNPEWENRKDKTNNLEEGAALQRSRPRDRTDGPGNTRIDGTRPADAGKAPQWPEPLAQSLAVRPQLGLRFTSTMPAATRASAASRLGVTGSFSHSAPKISAKMGVRNTNTEIFVAG